MKLIGHSAYWRNTLLFAIGRFFVEAQMRTQRDRIRTLCEDINREGNECARSGSVLALDILISGTIGNVPLISRSLSACSLQLLENPPVSYDSLLPRLAEVYDCTLFREYSEAINLRMGRTNFEESLAAWVLLFLLEQRGIAWATERIINYWPNNPEDIFSILQCWLEIRASRSSGQITIDAITQERIERQILRFSVRGAKTLFQNIDLRIIAPKPGWVASLIDWLLKDEFLERELQVRGSPSALILRTNQGFWKHELVFAHLSQVAKSEVIHEDWRTILELDGFSRAPSATSLAAALIQLAERVPSSDWVVWRELMPWPIAACVVWAKEKSNLLSLAERIQDESNGSCEQWLSIPNCDAKYITLEQLSQPIFPCGPCFADGLRGASMSAAPSSVSEIVVRAIVETIKPQNGKNGARMYIWLLSFYATCAKQWGAVDPILDLRECLGGKEHWWSGEVVVSKAVFDANPRGWLDFYEALGECDTLRYSRDYDFSGEDGPLDSVLAVIEKHPSKCGLIRIAGLWCAAGAPTAFIGMAKWIFLTIEDSRYKLFGLLIQLADRSIDLAAANRIAGCIADAIKDNLKFLDALLRAIESLPPSTPGIEQIVNKFIEAIPRGSTPVLAHAMQLRIAVVQAQKSGLSLERAQSLELPPF